MPVAGPWQAAAFRVVEAVTAPARVAAIVAERVDRDGDVAAVTACIQPD